MSIRVSLKKDEAAQVLAAAHYRIDPAILRIFRVLQADREIELRPEEPIKLLEVNADTIAVGIQPVFFGPDPSNNLYFPSIILEIRPEEYEALVQEAMRLPNGWRLGPEYPRPVGG